ncbi:MAG: ribosomal protein glutamine methyltransferase [Proteobacteria bacterium]|nr:ribosomal protein glutamine methyltransferase [Pseudomonadota bacterium]
MPRPPVPRAPPHPDVATVAELIAWAARRLSRARLHYGHGTDNPRDEAGALVFHALGLAHDDAARAYALPVDAAAIARAADLVDRRIRERVPSAYLTGRTWFAGHEIEVTPDVLVPRSPIAELCETGFAPWTDAARVRRVLDIGTGSGCIAIACAYAFPAAQVDATDISPAALEVAKRNIGAHGLQGRVSPLLSDVYSGVGDRRYDIIVSNPPYVPEAEMRALPSEYHREPRIGLAAGERGLDVVRRILAGADEHLEPGGLLVVEVGDSQAAVQESWPRVPFTWLEFERGGGGVFALAAADVHRCRRYFRRES